MNTFDCGHCGGLNNTATLVNNLREFHEKFNQRYAGNPRALPMDEHRFRMACMLEEPNEFNEHFVKYRDAVKTGRIDIAEKELAEMLDALVDSAYFTLGTAYRMGFLEPHSPGRGRHALSIFDEAWARVHAKNMEKELATEANPSKRGKFNEFDIVKPEGWEPADLRDLVKDKLELSEEE